MINAFSIFKRNGCVLWDHEAKGAPVEGKNPIGDMVSDVLMVGGASESLYKTQEYTVKWTFENKLGLIFACVYYNFARMSNVDGFLESIRKAFVDKFSERLNVSPESVPRGAKNVLTSDPWPAYEFDSEYLDVLRRFARKGTRSGHSGGANKQPRVKQTPRAPEKGASVGGGGDNEEDADDTAADGDEPLASPSSPGKKGDAKLAEMRKALGLGVRRGGRGKRSGGRKKNQKKPTSPQPGKPKKQMRTWGALDKVTAGSMDALDCSDDKGLQGSMSPELKDSFGAVPEAGQSEYVDNLRFGEEEDSDESYDEDDYRLSGFGGQSGAAEEGDANRKKRRKKKRKKKKGKVGGESKSTASTSSSKDGWFSGWVKRLSGRKQLSQDDLDPVMASLKEQLMKKNVAAEIAIKLCDSVASSLEGKTLDKFSTITGTVRSALRKSLTQILTPKQDIDVLQGIRSANLKGRPYTIAFVGVNGVGKSTSLAKIAAWLRSQSLQVSIAACDTFRSGAIEQLQTHAKALGGVRVFAKGYNMDAAGVARAAIKEGAEQSDNVVLIDTAGRMEDNQGLMKALVKLVSVNQPDLLLFVGEALVGNAAVHQLTVFNRCLRDYSRDGNPRLIDGCILTKFDTIDDKVGAAISMTYTTHAPIVFVGTGQRYKDLKRLNVEYITGALLN